MARFLPEYKELDTRPSWEKVATTISLLILLLLVPTTVLGYYSETSLPGQPLYSMKRGIESLVLLIETYSPYKKSLYYQSLATKRVNETVTVVAQAAANGDFNSSDAAVSDLALNEIVVTVKQAAQSTDSISNPVQKQQAQQQLTQSIKNYKTQLTQMNYTIQQHILTPTPTPQETTTTTSGLPTPTPAPSDTAALQDQITQTEEALQNISQDLQTTPTNMPTPTPKDWRHNNDNHDR